jgi:hypothetical protein
MMLGSYLLETRTSSWIRLEMFEESFAGIVGAVRATGQLSPDCTFSDLAFGAAGE